MDKIEHFEHVVTLCMAPNDTHPFWTSLPEKSALG